MLRFMVKEIVRDLDQDGDKQLSLPEFISLPVGTVENQQGQDGDDSWVRDRKREFEELIDSDRDGIVTAEELEVSPRPACELCAGTGGPGRPWGHRTEEPLGAADVEEGSVALEAPVSCTLAGKSTQQPASNSSDAVCEDRGPPATRPQGTQAPTARPTTARATEAWPRTSQGPSTRPAEVPGGPAVAAILGLGLALGLLGPLAMLLALHLLRRDLRPPPDAPKPPGGGSFRTPIQEEQTDAHSALAKI
nr:tumor necrosis factor receptor superfamily member 4-like [Aotus nancymaae]